MSRWKDHQSEETFEPGDQVLIHEPLHGWPAGGVVVEETNVGVIVRYALPTGVIRRCSQWRR
jgi:hypothetical protein